LRLMQFEREGHMASRAAEYKAIAAADAAAERITARLVTLVQDITNSSCSAEQIVTCFGAVGLPAGPQFIENVLQRRWQLRKSRGRIYSI
jgi:hypothetical protein